MSKFFEEVFASTLDKLKIAFVRQKKINTSNRRFYIDFYLPTYSMYIEIDEFQHFPRKRTKTTEQQIDRDIELNEFMLGGRFCFVRVSFADLHESRCEKYIKYLIYRRGENSSKPQNYIILSNKDLYHNINRDFWRISESKIRSLSHEMSGIKYSFLQLIGKV